MGIELSPVWRAFVEDRIASGAFATEAEVIEAALSELERRERSTAIERRLIQEALDSGPAVEISFDEIRRMARERADAG